MHAVRANRGDQTEDKGDEHCIRLVRLLIVSLLLAAILVACTVARVTRPVIKIGLVAPFEGPYRYVGYDAIYAVRLALREASAGRGVAGHSIELVAYDDRGTVGGAVTAARNLTLDSQVIAVIGHYRDVTTRAALEIYERAGLPLFTAGTVEGGTSTPSDLFCPLFEYLRTSTGLASYQIQWFTSDNPQLACADGLEVTTSQQIPVVPGSDVVLLTLDPLAAGESLTELYESGWDGIVAGGPTLGSPLFSKLVDPAGVFFVSPYRWPEPEGTDADFSTIYQSLDPHVSPPGPFALTSYQAAQAVLAELDAALQKGKTRIPIRFRAGQSSRNSVYLYRWSKTGALELIEELEPSRGE